MAGPAAQMHMTSPQIGAFVSDILSKLSRMLQENLVVDVSFLAEMESNGCLTDELAEEIQVVQTSHRRARACMRILRQRGPGTLGRFLHALIRTSQVHVGTEIIQHCRDNNNNNNNEQDGIQVIRYIIETHNEELADEIKDTYPELR